MLYIRTDVGRQIASDHVMRCLSVAEKLSKYGEPVRFLVTEREAYNLVLAHGFPVRTVSGNWSRPETELEQLINDLQTESAEKLLVDLPTASAEYLEALSAHFKTICISVTEQFFSGICLLINYSNACDTAFYEKAYRSSETKLLLGVAYAPLREEFCGLRPVIRDDIENVLITAGGCGEHRIAERLAKDLTAYLPDIQFVLTAGSLNSLVPSLKRLANQNNRVTLVQNPSNMAAVMRNCDAAVSASGTTLYELCACGTPTICFSLTQEQAKCARRFDRDNMMAYAGDIINQYGDCLNRITASLRHLKENYFFRRCAAMRMNGYIDGLGSQRIAEEILKL